MIKKGVGMLAVRNADFDQFVEECDKVKCEGWEPIGNVCIYDIFGPVYVLMFKKRKVNDEN